MFKDHGGDLGKQIKFQGYYSKKLYGFEKCVRFYHQFS